MAISGSSTTKKCGEIGPTAPCRQKISETMIFAGHWQNCPNSKYCCKGPMISDGLKQQNDEETNIDP